MSDITVNIGFEGRVIKGIRVLAGDKIIDLKKRLCRQSLFNGQSPKNIELIHNGRNLLNNKTIAESGVKRNDMIRSELVQP